MWNALDCTRLVRERIKITIWPQCDLIALTLSITHCVGSKVSQLSTAPLSKLLVDFIALLILRGGISERRPSPVARRKLKCGWASSATAAATCRNRTARYSSSRLRRRCRQSPPSLARVG